MHRRPMLLSLLLALSAPLPADTLTIPAPGQAADGAPADATAAQPAAPAQGFRITLPGRGMTMEQVEAKFGPPRERLPSVGEPPITRWVYDDFTVYFEYEYVIDAVPNAAGIPRPAVPDAEAATAPTVR